VPHSGMIHSRFHFHFGSYSFLDKSAFLELGDKAQIDEQAQIGRSGLYF
jgi:hypothetical protein